MNYCIKKLRGVIEMFLRRYLDDIREKTAGMNKKERVSYVITYYWYHILIIVSIIALIFFCCAILCVWQPKTGIYVCARRSGDR